MHLTDWELVSQRNGTWYNDCWRLLGPRTLVAR